MIRKVLEYAKILLFTQCTYICIYIHNLLRKVMHKFVIFIYFSIFFKGLLSASKRRDEDGVKSALEKKADVNCKDEVSYNVLLSQSMLEVNNNP